MAKQNIKKSLHAVDNTYEEKVENRGDPERKGAQEEESSPSAREVENNKVEDDEGTDDPEKSGEEQEAEEEQVEGLILTLPASRISNRPLHKQLLNFFSKDYEDTIFMAETLEQMDRVKSLARHQMEALRVAGILAFVMTLPSSTEDDREARLWAIDNAMGMGPAEIMGRQEAYETVTTADLMSGVLRYVEWVIDETQFVREELELNPGDGSSVRVAVELLESKMNVRWDFPRPPLG